MTAAEPVVPASGECQMDKISDLCIGTRYLTADKWEKKTLWIRVAKNVENQDAAVGLNPD